MDMGFFKDKMNDCKYCLPDKFDHYKYTKKNMEIIEHNFSTPPKGRHAAGLIAIKKPNFFSKDDVSVFADGIDLLLNFFQERTTEIPFHVYVCYFPDDAKRIIENPNIESIWIFGHGHFFGIDFGKRGFLKYCLLKDAGKKKFIAQLHCNDSSSSGCSLADFILTENGQKYVKEGFRYTRLNRLAIEYGNSIGWDMTRWTRQDL